MNEFKMNNVNVAIMDKVLLSDFSFSFHENICVLGESGSGKSYLLKTIFQNIPLEYVSSTEFYFGELKTVKNWKSVLDFDSLSEDYQKFFRQFFENGQNIDLKCALCLKLLTRPHYFFSEDFSLSYKDFQTFISFLKEKNILFFFVTNDIEKTVFFDYLFVLKNNQVAIEGKSLLVLKEEKLMKLLGFSLPFYINMSIQLGYYGLLHDIYLNKEDMEVALWQSK